MKNEWGEVRLGIDAYDLAGKRALVIGAGARAGRAIALALGEAGADITISSVTTDGEEVMRARRVQQGVPRRRVPAGHEHLMKLVQCRVSRRNGYGPDRPTQFPRSIFALQSVQQK